MNAPERRDIPGYEGLYAITREGRVWAHPRAWVTGVDGNIKLAHRGMWLQSFGSKRGYVSVNLHRDGKARSRNVHRLVAETWIPNPLNLPQVNHINAVKSDNRDTNLEWCTASHNKRHAVAMGLCPTTEVFRASVRRNSLKARAVTRKLTQQQAEEVRARFAAGERKTALAKAFGIERSTVWSIVNLKTYREALPQ